MLYISLSLHRSLQNAQKLTPKLVHAVLYQYIAHFSTGLHSGLVSLSNSIRLAQAHRQHEWL